jgi:outer membrane receptor protein involved in Fe transport
VLVASVTPQSVTFDPEEADGFELGIKSILLDNRLRANATIYSYDFKDLQVSAFDNATTSFRITNAASSESTGIEFDFEYLLTERFTLRGQAGYNDGEYNDFTTAPCFAGQTPAQGCNPATGTQNLSGTRLGFAPEWSGSLGFEYRQPIGTDLAFQISYDAIYTDEYVTGGHPLASQDAFWKHNARAGVMSVDDTWSVMFIGRNLSEEWQNGGCADKPGGAPGDIFCQVARARQLILQASYRM